jgi:hypothetical protein
MLHLHPGAFETGRLPRASSPAARRVVISVCTRLFFLVVDRGDADRGPLTRPRAPRPALAAALVPSRAPLTVALAPEASAYALQRLRACDSHSAICDPHDHGPRARG